MDQVKNSHDEAAKTKTLDEFSPDKEDIAGVTNAQLIHDREGSGEENIPSGPGMGGDGA